MQDSIELVEGTTQEMEDRVRILEPVRTELTVAGRVSANEGQLTGRLRARPRHSTLRSSALDYNQMSSPKWMDENENEKYSRDITLLHLISFLVEINSAAYPPDYRSDPCGK